MATKKPSKQLHFLLKQGQEKLGALQNISLEQVDTLKVKIGAVQKQMGAVWKVSLKKITVLLVTVKKLSTALLYGSSKEVTTLQIKACDHIFSLKVHVLDAPEKEVSSLWQKLVALEDVLYDFLARKLGALAEKEKALCGKVDALQKKLWNSLQAALIFLRETLGSLWDDAPCRELDELQGYPVYPLQERMAALQKTRDGLGEMTGPLEKKVSPMEENMESVLEIVGASLEDDKAMEVDRTGFSERRDAQDTGTEQVDTAAGKIRDQPRGAGTEMALLSSTK